MLSVNNKFNPITIGQIFYAPEKKRAELALDLRVFNQLDQKITGIVYTLKVDGKNKYIGRTGQKESDGKISGKRFRQHLSLVNTVNTLKNKKVTFSKIDKTSTVEIASKIFKKIKNKKTSKNKELKKINKINECKKLHQFIDQVFKKNKDSCIEIDVIDTAESSTELMQKEIDKIIECNTLYPIGQNMILGGGGFAIDKKSYLPFQSPGKNFATKSELKEFLTPGKQKSYSIVKNIDGSFSIPIPSEIKEIKNVIYRIKKEDVLDEVLIGKTEQTFGDRIAQYVHEINYSDKSLYQDIRENWLNYSVGIALEVKNKENPFQAEIYVIKKTKELYSDENERKVINQNGGGGGGASCRNTLTF